VCRLTANNLLRYFEVIRKRADLSEFGEPFQTMRRSRAQDWSQESPTVPMNTLAEWMGHGIDVAAKFYLRTSDETLARVTGRGTDAAMGQPLATNSCDANVQPDKAA
jgi:hypothetical protein